jgi:hypothetical protein
MFGATIAASTLITAITTKTSTSVNPHRGLQLRPCWGSWPLRHVPNDDEAADKDQRPQRVFLSGNSNSFQIPGMNIVMAAQLGEPADENVGHWNEQISATNKHGAKSLLWICFRENDKEHNDVAEFLEPSLERNKGVFGPQNRDEHVEVKEKDSPVL